MTNVLSVEVQVAPHRPTAIAACFELAAGITVLLGPSGVGKTTLLLTIAGLLRPHAGCITLGSRVLFDSASRLCLPPEARRVGLVFQSLALFPHLSALDNVAYGVSRALSGPERKERARYWLERSRVLHVADRKPFTFSGGEGQRVALARALASDPEVLLLDEPFSAMDEALREDLGNELIGVTRELAIPVLLVTHDRNDAQRLSERVLTMSEGRVHSH